MGIISSTTATATATATAGLEEPRQESISALLEQLLPSPLIDIVFCYFSYEIADYKKDKIIRAGYVHDWIFLHNSRQDIECLLGGLQIPPEIKDRIFRDAGAISLTYDSSWRLEDSKQLRISYARALDEDVPHPIPDRMRWLYSDIVTPGSFAEIVCSQKPDAIRKMKVRLETQSCDERAFIAAAGCGAGDTLERLKMLRDHNYPLTSLAIVAAAFRRREDIIAFLVNNLPHRR